MSYECSAVELDNIGAFVDSLEDEIKRSGLEANPLDLEVAHLSLTAIANLLDDYLADIEAPRPVVDRSIQIG